MDEVEHILTRPAIVFVLTAGLRAIERIYIYIYLYLLYVLGLWLYALLVETEKYKSDAINGGQFAIKRKPFSGFLRLIYLFMIPANVHVAQLCFGALWL